MADQKVSNLPALNGAGVDSADLLYIVDSSAGTAGSKKITIGQYQLAPYSAATANTVVYFNGSKVPTSSSALTFDGTNLGIGTSSPGTKLEIRNDVAATTDLSPTAIKLLNNLDGGSGIEFSNSVAGKSKISFGVEASGASTDDTYLAFSTCLNAGALTERARITSGGDLLVGDTTQPTSANNRLAVIGTRGIDCKNTGGATAPNITAWNNATAGDNIFVSFRTETTDTQRGSITYNRAGGLVAYNTTSDYRAKDILGPVADPGATIDALKVYEGRMKGATQSRPMLVAHEAQEHAPYAVSGEKDEVNEDGTPKYQQMDVSSLVPLLLAEIQSLRARVAALEAK